MRFISPYPAYSAGPVWRTVDLTQPPFNFPAEATGVAVRLIMSGSPSSSNFGIRKKGSTDPYYANAIASSNFRPFYIGCNENREFEWYGDGLLVVYGYFTYDAVFFTNSIDKNPGIGGEWLTIDLSSDIPEEAVAAFFLLRQNAQQKSGARKYGSTDTHRSWLYGLQGVCVGLDSNKKCQFCLDNSSIQVLKLVGYLKEGTFLDNAIDKSLSQIGQWIDISISGDNPPPQTEGVLVNAFIDVENPTQQNKYVLSLRRKGDTEGDAQSPHWIGWFAPGVNSEKKYQGYIQDLTVKFKQQGYFIYSWPREERLMTVKGLIYEWNSWECPDSVVVCSILEEDYISPEKPLIVAVAIVDSFIGLEIGSLASICQVSVLDYQTYREEVIVIKACIVRAVTAGSGPPAVKGRSPKPNETAAKRNKKVSFYIYADQMDWVDVSTMNVEIDGVAYDYLHPEFSYSGTGDAYYIEVDHPVFDYEKTVQVKIDAKSMSGQIMDQAVYSYQTEWEAKKERSGLGRVELFYQNDYDVSVLTVQEDWVLQGNERESSQFELWYGRYQILPFVEDIVFRVIAGDTIPTGKEALDSGFLSVKVGSGGWASIYSNSIFHLGTLFCNSKKDLKFKLFVSENSLTKGYVVLKLSFTPKTVGIFGRLICGKGLFGSDYKFIGIHDNEMVYRACVFDKNSWNELMASGFIPSPFYRGEDKQW